MRDEAQAGERAKLEEEQAAYLAEVEALEATIPAGWEEVHKTFAALTKAEEVARSKYRRAADGAWEEPALFLATLDGNDDFAALETQLMQLRAVIEGATVENNEEAMETIDVLEDLFGAIEGARDVKSPLGKARRALKGDEPDVEKAMGLYEEALTAYAAQQAWRGDAESALRGDVQTYLDGIRGTIGIRSQDRLTRDQALEIASCSAHHRDISLSF
jgi:hypothetical protein